MILLCSIYIDTPYVYGIPIYIHIQLPLINLYSHIYIYRFINHSCDPNCHIVLFKEHPDSLISIPIVTTRRRIRVHEEVCVCMCIFIYMCVLDVYICIIFLYIFMSILCMVLPLYYSYTPIYIYIYYYTHIRIYAHS